MYTLMGWEGANEVNKCHCFSRQVTQGVSGFRRSRKNVSSWEAAWCEYGGHGEGRAQIPEFISSETEQMVAMMKREGHDSLPLRRMATQLGLIKNATVCWDIRQYFKQQKQGTRCEASEEWQNIWEMHSVFNYGRVWTLLGPLGSSARYRWTVSCFSHYN